MKSLSDLQAVLGGLKGSIGGLQQQIDDCVDCLAQITGSAPKLRGPYQTKANGEALREKVKRHFMSQRGKWNRLSALKLVENTGANVTVIQAAKMLKLSDASVRNKIRAGELKAMKEMHATRKGVAPHPVMVVNRNDVLALANNRNGGQTNLVVGHVQPKTTTKARPGARTGHRAYQSLAEQRQASVVFLSSFDHAEPRPSKDHRIGPLVRRGYLAKKGDGYTRTNKEYLLHPKSKRDRTNGSGKSPNQRPTNKEGRARTAELLATLDREQPRPIVPSGRAGSLVQHGYVKSVGDGYVRTAKPYSV